MNLHKMIEIYLKYDNMHIFVVINALICINNHVITCINIMLSAAEEPGCSRSFSHLSDVYGRLDPHRTDDDRASAGLIDNDRDHHLPDLDRTAGRRRGGIP